MKAYNREDPDYPQELMTGFMPLSHEEAVQLSVRRKLDYQSAMISDIRWFLLSLNMLAIGCLAALLWRAAS